MPTTGSALPGKNTWPNTSAAAVPYRKKSYHSSALPTTEAITARRSTVRAASGCSVPTVMAAPVARRSLTVGVPRAKA